MNGVLLSALSILAISIGSIIWGWVYRTNHALEGMGAMFGVATATYSAAGWALGLGILGFLIGIGLLIAGLVKGKQPPK